MISLFTRAMISSTTAALSGLGLTGGAAGFGFNSFSFAGGSASGAVCGCSSFCAGGVGSRFGAFDGSGEAPTQTANNAPARAPFHCFLETKSFIQLPLYLFSLAPPLKPEQYVSQCSCYRLAALHLHPEHSRRIKPDSVSRPHYADQSCRIEWRLRVKTHSQPVPLPLHGRNAQ